MTGGTYTHVLFTFTHVLSMPFGYMHAFIHPVPKHLNSDTVSESCLSLCIYLYMTQTFCSFACHPPEVRFVRCIAKRTYAMHCVRGFRGLSLRMHMLPTVHGRQNHAEALRAGSVCQHCPSLEPNAV